MIKHSNEKYQETYYSEQLTNGLRVIIWEKPDYVNSAFYLATPFGALHNKQKAQGKTYEFSGGIQHFLEHKMFESADHSDVMTDFTRWGCNINAFTSYHETVYYFSTVKSQVAEPLNKLRGIGTP